MNFKKLIRNKKVAFTLAEVVVVMAILSVMMVAFAPVVTQRTLNAGSSGNKVLFDIMDGNEGLSYGTVGDNKPVVIGDSKVNSSSFSPKLLVVGTKNTSNSSYLTPQIGFGYNTTGSGNATYTGQISMQMSSSAVDSSGAKEYAGNTIVGGRYDNNKGYQLVSTSYWGNTIVGTDAGTQNTATTKGMTAIGAGACRNNTGMHTVCIGARSGATSTDSTDYTIYIGNNQWSYLPTNIYFGNKTLDTIISSCAISTGGDEGTDSDIRLKNVGKEYTAGLDEINQLNFYHYTYKRDMEKTPRVGVMAQDLQKVFPDAVSENKEGYLYIRKDDMFYAALNAIKQLFAGMTDNSAKIKELEERNAVLEKQVQELQEMYTALAKQQNNTKIMKKKLTQTPPKAVVEEEVPQEVLEEASQEVSVEAPAENP